MKIKSLFALLVVLAAAVFAVACGGGTDTTVAPGTDAPGATTTKATTTKVTTTKKTTTKKTTVVTTAATTLPREITFSIPAKLPENKAYDATLIFDGSETDVVITDQKAVDKGSSYDIFTQANGNKVFAYHIADNYMQANLNLGPYVFSGTETGYMFYADYTQIKPKTPLCLGPRLKVDGQWFQSGSHNNSIMKKPDEMHYYGYYLSDGDIEWVKTENYDNCRLVVPDYFKGWIYVPFTQMSHNGDGLLLLSDQITSYPGECIMEGFMIYNGGTLVADGATTSDCYFDNILVVTAK